MITEVPDPFIGDPLIEHGKAKVDIVLYSVHVGCPQGNIARIEQTMSAQDYNGASVHLEAANFFTGDEIPSCQTCPTCGTENGLIYLGSDKI